MSEGSKLAVEVVSFKAMDRNSLKGFVTVRIPAMRLTIRDCTVHESHGKRWVGLPSKAQIGRDQELVRKDGKIQYAAVFEFDSKAVGDAFSAAVLRALDARVDGAAA
ncbi:hypothetical protein [Methylobacterium nodulans]|uniref:Uncharacterized protein n=1 Tax=Methylobacterium nodulans (strain LMG 21967 / CNCM I-2342 / ORS 2060) TaxID=460265 RepID=B8IE40_METNO|nr:hypothetical protein [Methylobacterium nodulans]ACL57586.1 hypothetical protein Mnod_2623 [Methylobacterium nodulans ORS 2060]